MRGLSTVDLPKVCGGDIQYVNGVLQTTGGVTPTLYGNGSFYIQTGDGWSAFVRADGTWTIWNEANEQEFDSSDVTSDSGPVRVVEVSRIGA